MRAWGLSAALLVACASTSTSTKRPEELSAAGHREEAARERAQADAAYARFQPNTRAPLPGAPAGSSDAPGFYPIDLFPYNPTDRALAATERHLRHAREHEAAAQALEGFEEAECRTLSPKTRAACPVLGPVESIEDLVDGVHVIFAASAPVQELVAHMRCHLAFARAHGFTEPSDCPLYMKGVEIVAAADGRGVDITSRNRTVAREVQMRSRVAAIPKDR